MQVARLLVSCDSGVGERRVTSFSTIRDVKGWYAFDTLMMMICLHSIVDGHVWKSHSVIYLFKNPGQGSEYSWPHLSNRCNTMWFCNLQRKTPWLWIFFQFSIFLPLRIKNNFFLRVNHLNEYGGGIGSLMMEHNGILLQRGWSDLS